MLRNGVIYHTQAQANTKSTIREHTLRQCSHFVCLMTMNGCFFPTEKVHLLNQNDAKSDLRNVIAKSSVRAMRARNTKKPIRFFFFSSVSFHFVLDMVQIGTELNTPPFICVHCGKMNNERRSCAFCGCPAIQFGVAFFFRS